MLKDVKGGPGNWVTDELPCKCWDLNLRPLRAACAPNHLVIPSDPGVVSLRVMGVGEGRKPPVVMTDRFLFVWVVNVFF